MWPGNSLFSQYFPHLDSPRAVSSKKDRLFGRCRKERRRRLQMGLFWNLLWRDVLSRCPFTLSLSLTSNAGCRRSLSVRDLPLELEFLLEVQEEEGLMDSNLRSGCWWWWWLSSLFVVLIFLFGRSHQDQQQQNGDRMKCLTREG